MIFRTKTRKRLDHIESVLDELREDIDAIERDMPTGIDMLDINGHDNDIRDLRDDLDSLRDRVDDLEGD